MLKYLKLLAVYVVLAVVAVVLYAPWFVGLPLNPFDPTVPLLDAGISVLAAIGLGGVFVGATLHALRTPRYQLLESSSVAGPDDVRPVLADYQDVPQVGGFAADALAQLDSMERKHARLTRALDAKFGEGSLSYDRFAGVVGQAESTIVRNCAVLCNKVQAFDADAFRAQGKPPKLTRGSSPSDDDDLAIERRRLYETSLDEMRAILTANERLLLELAKLKDELSDLEDSSNQAANGAMVQEIQELIDQTKLYQ